MPCAPEELRHVPLFALLDDDEAGILAAQIEVRRFATRQQIYRAGEPSIHAYILMTGKVLVSTTDEDQQEVLVDEPQHGDFFGFASMLAETSHMTSAMATEDTECLEVGRDDLAELLRARPLAGMDMLTVQARQFQCSQAIVRRRVARNPNEIIESRTTFGQDIADHVARFGGSWTFIILFGITLAIYSAINVMLKGSAWDPYPFILLNLFLSMLASIQAPVIMMSQNRQDEKDRLRGELDFEVNRRAEAEIQSLSGKLVLITDKIEDLEEMLRERLARLDPASE